MEADYIVIGAGSAGSAVAARLLAQGSLVALVEAGKRERLGITRLPAALNYTIGNERYDWKYTTEPDPTRDGIVEGWPRGRVPGGSSAINGMIFIRGAAEDFDQWEALGNRGWGWDSVLPYFRRMETADQDKDNSFRGGMGPQRVSALRYRHPTAEAFIESAVSLGIPLNPDLNGKSHEGVAWNQGSTRNGFRHSSWEAYIRPQLRNPRLRFLDGAQVERVMFDGRRATGVALKRDGQSISVTAKAGVVLSAGAINTPHLLMLSGIGPAEHLKGHGITPALDAPDVGRNLLEHPGLYVHAELNVPTVNRYASPLRRVFAVADWLLTRKGPLSVPTAQVLAFFKSSADQVSSDLQFHLFPFGSFIRDGKREIPDRNLVTILVNASYPKSKGWLELKSRDPFTPIAIHPRLLDHQDDFETVLRGLDWMRKIASAAPFGSMVQELIGVPPSSAGRAADEKFIRTATRPFYHPVGTCRMGTDERAVVSPDLKVRGTQNLWVADASIFPRHIAGNTNATSIMIGDRAADLIHSNG